MTAAAVVCGSCGTELPPNSKFCNECGAAVATAPTPAEYKQVTVLFADVVHSMDIAAAVGAERLREIMAELVDRSAAVVKRYGGTLSQFTGDGIMAVFGAPITLEDHAVRACLAALGIQEEAKRLAAEVQDRDGIDLRLRVGLNSGQVIAGEIGSGALGYTAIGEQVGMAQRMESVAPPGGVMLSASTARLVDGAAALGEPEMVRIKGADEPVRRPPAVGHGRTASRRRACRVESGWAAVGDVRRRGLVGPCGRWPRRGGRRGGATWHRQEPSGARGGGDGASTVTSRCSPPSASRTPARSPSTPSRGCCARPFGVEGLDTQVARDGLRERITEADPEDLLLFDDLLGIADPDIALPKIDPDARRRRLTALVNAASLARTKPRRSMSLRTRIGLTRSASRCWPSSSR